MSLLVYKQTSPGVYTSYTVNGQNRRPITTVHHGRNGDTFELKLYVGRSSGDSHTYSNIRLEPVSLTSEKDIDPEIVGSSGWGVKLMVDPGHDPTETEWDQTDYGNTINLSDISSDAKLPFWYRIESPRGENIKNKRNIALYLMFVESV